jgi:hypothetical protein
MNGVFYTVHADIYISKSVSVESDSWSNKLVVRQSPAGKNVSTEAEDIVEIHH